MPGPVPKPPAQRRTRHKPIRGEWKAAPGMGWQHGPIPEPPDGLISASRTAWQVWMESGWFAANWLAADLPVLRQLIVLFDHVERGRAKAADRAELRQLLDSFGVTPRGRQDRRWLAPKAPEEPMPAAPQAASTVSGQYAHLRVVGE